MPETFDRESASRERPSHLLEVPLLPASGIRPRMAVVLAAGRSERLRAVTGGGSKALIQLGGLKLVERAGCCLRNIAGTRSSLRRKGHAFLKRNQSTRVAFPGLGCDRSKLQQELMLALEAVLSPIRLELCV